MQMVIRLPGKQDARNPLLMLCGAETDEDEEQESPWESDDVVFSAANGVK
jgi:hypothetical protein